MQLRDFPGAQNIPIKEVGSHALLAELSAESVPSESIPTAGEVDSHNAEFPSSLSWLYCATLAISLYCMGIIGVLHKGLDDDNYLRIPKVNFHAIRSFKSITLFFFLTIVNFFVFMCFFF